MTTNTLILTIFVASLAGSLHCAGMCGAFAVFAIGIEGDKRGNRVFQHVAYNGGRLITYTLLGVACGSIGAMLNLGGSLMGVQQSAAILAGSMMVFFGGAAILRAFGVRLPDMPSPNFVKRVLQRGHGAAMRMPNGVRAGVVGLLTTFLPCGWLYAFAITAAGTADPVKGGLVMAAFWAGTTPVLVFVGVGVQKLTAYFGRRVALVAPIAVVVVGLVMIVQRITIPTEAFAAPLNPPASVEEAVEQIEKLDSTKMPCCRHGS